MTSGSYLKDVTAASCGGDRLVLLFQPGCMFYILTLLICRVEQCLRCVRRRLRAHQRTVLHQRGIQTEEGLVVAKGVQTSCGRDHRIAEDRVWEDRVESERGAKKWLLHRGFGVICGNSNCWVSRRFDRRSGLRLTVIGVWFWLLPTRCFLLIIALFWTLDRRRVSLDRHPAVAVYTGASGRPLRCGNDTAGSGETFGRPRPFQSPLFPQRGGEAVETAWHWGWLTLNIQHCDRWTRWGSGSFSFARAQFRTPIEPWVHFDCAHWIWQATCHFPSWPPSDALCTPCEPEVLREPKIFLFWYRLDSWILTAGDGHGRSFLSVLLLCVLGGGGIAGWLVGGGGAAWWGLLDGAAAIWPRLIFQAQAELPAALTLGSTLDAIQPWKEIMMGFF